MNAFSFIKSGGLVSYILLFVSVLSVSIIINKVIFFVSLSMFDIDKFISRIRDAFINKNIDRIYDYAGENKNIFSNIVLVFLHNLSMKTEDLEKKLIFVIDKNDLILEKYLLALGTIANISVYLGLLGTIIGIMEAFSNIEASGMSGINVVIGGVSKALTTTIFGLIISIPAVIVYNFCSTSAEKYHKSMINFANTLISFRENYDKE